MKLPVAHRNRMAARLARLASCCIAAALLWACGPVYIPVPPPTPAAPAFTAQLVTDAAGNTKQVWIGTGNADRRAGNATFYLFNQDRNTGVISRAAADGSYVAPAMDGTEGDHVQVYYLDTRGENSDTRCVLLSEMQPNADDCL